MKLPASTKGVVTTLVVTALIISSSNISALAQNFSEDPNSLAYPGPLAAADGNNFDMSSIAPLTSAQDDATTEGGVGDIGATGVYGNQTYATNEGLGQATYGDSGPTTQQSSAFAQTAYASLSQSGAPPVTTTASLVFGSIAPSTPPASTGYVGSNPIVSLPTAYVPLDKVFGGGGALPPTTLDGFVASAGGQAELIYGDEGSTSIPPYFGFDPSHYINTGINWSGLTTGNYTPQLPSAWGYPQ